MADIERNQARADRIVAARRKLLDRLEADSEHKLAERWRGKVAEYEESLRNFHKFGQEAKPTGRTTVVDIGVPLAELGIKSQTTGG